MTSEREEHIADLRDRLEKVEGKIRQRRKDFWDKFQILAAMLTPAVIALVGLLVQRQLQQNQLELTYEAEKRREYQLEQQKREETTKLVLDVIAGRELADTQIRAQMFEALLKGFFEDKPENIKEQVTLLHLMQTNFVEYFNTRPLFEMIHEQIEGMEDPEEADKLKKRMKRAAKAIVERQEVLLGAGNVKVIELPVSEEDWEGWSEKRSIAGHLMTFKVTEATEDFAHLILRPEHAEEAGFSEINFDVHYYDMPFVDYVTLADGHRFAVTFKGLKNSQDREVPPSERVAILKVFHFPENRLLSRDRPTMEMVYSFVKDLRKGIDDHDDDHAQDDEHGENEPVEDVLADPLTSHDPVFGREPGLYLKESVRRGEPIVETMLSIETANGDGRALDRPADLAHVLGGCFARDMEEGERLEWTDIEACE
ncbi:MAG: hypothetical protein V3T84_14445 [Phycisphaerales bacterium]